MAAPTYASRWPLYAKQWNDMQRTRMSALQKTATRLLGYKQRYQAVEARTKVPWYMIAVIHMRESDADFTTQLAQGDPLDRVSTHVPKGQGPYRGADAWERAALIALEDAGLTKVIDWRLEKSLFFLEKYNGWGYANHGMVSPYLWAGTDQYVAGKYTADGVLDRTVVDGQLGCAPTMKTLADLDSTIQFVRETAEDTPPTPPVEELPTITITVTPAGSAHVRVVGSADD